VTGTLFAQAREYMPSVGRFVSEDLIRGFMQAPYTLNQYAYCWNDPMNLVDLDGLAPTTLEAALMADYMYARPNRSLAGGWELQYIYDNNGRHDADNIEGYFPNMMMGVFARTSADGTVEYALVNRGTVGPVVQPRINWGLTGPRIMLDLGPNWGDNVAQLGGNSQDMADSIRIAREFVDSRDECTEITMIGHSKGGAEARMNAFATGMNAIIFNPASSSWFSAGSNGIPRDNIHNFQGSMRTYIVEGDVLNFAQGWATNHIGELIMLPRQYNRWWRPFGDLGANHSMSAVIEALGGRP